MRRIQFTELNCKAYSLLLGGQEVLRSDSDFAVSRYGERQIVALFIDIAEIVVGLVCTLIDLGQLRKFLTGLVELLQFNVEKRHGEKGFPVLRILSHHGGELCLRHFIALILDKQPRIGQAKISFVFELAHTL